MKNRKGIVGLLLLPPILIILLLVGIGLLLFLPQSPFKLAIFQTVDFAGFTWQDSGTLYNTPTGLSSTNNCNVGGGSSSIEKRGEFLLMDLSASGVGVQRYIETDITNIDEVLVIYEGFGQASCQNGHSNSGAGISGLVVGSVSGEVGMGQSIGTSSCPSSGSSVSSIFEPSLWKFRNNFDGTWSTLQGLGVGDIFLVKDTQKVTGTPKLRLSASGGNGCGNYGSGQVSLKLYNVVVKENAFAVCKADEFWQDKNQDKTPTSDECFDLQTIVLNSEEAIKESFDAKLLRVEQELLAKQAGLTQDNAKLEAKLKELQEQQASALQQQELVDKINALEVELKITNQRLADVQAGDKDVIAVVEADAKLKEHNIIKSLWNRIIALFKNLFS